MPSSVRSLLMDAVAGNAQTTLSTRTSLATGVLYWPRDVSPSISVATFRFSPLLLVLLCQ